MRSLMCWLLKASGVAEVVPVGEQRKKKKNRQDVFLTVMIRLLLPSSSLRKHCPNALHIKEREPSVCLHVCHW